MCAQIAVGGVSQQGEYGYYNGTGLVDNKPEHAADEAGAGGSMTPGESDAAAQSAQAGGDIALQHMERGMTEPYGRIQPTDHSTPTKEDTARSPSVTHSGQNIPGYF